MSPTAWKRSSLTHQIAAVALLLSSASLADDSAFPPWRSSEDQILLALSEGEVLSLTPIGHGVTNPFRAKIEYDGKIISAVWKPIDPQVRRTATESYRAEVAAYRISELLGLHQVPPTVERTIQRTSGSLQYWVDDVQRFAEAGSDLLSSARFRRDLARMRLFDRVILNPDRNSSNFLVNARGRIVLIDHSRALSFDAPSRSKKRELPSNFDRALVDALRSLDLEGLQAALQGLVPKHRLKALLKERDRMIRDVDARVSSHGTLLYFD